MASGVGAEGSEQAVGEAWVGEQRSEFGGDVVAHVCRRSGDFVDDLLAAVDEGDDVAEVAAAEEVAVAAALERLELGGEQVGR